MSDPQYYYEAVQSDHQVNLELQKEYGKKIKGKFGITTTSKDPVYLPVVIKFPDIWNEEQRRDWYIKVNWNKNPAKQEIDNFYRRTGQWKTNFLGRWDTESGTTPDKFPVIDAKRWEASIDAGNPAFSKDFFTGESPTKVTIGLSLDDPGFWRSGVTEAWTRGDFNYYSPYATGVKQSILHAPMFNAISPANIPEKGLAPFPKKDKASAPQQMPDVGFKVDDFGGVVGTDEPKGQARTATYATESENKARDLELYSKLFSSKDNPFGDPINFATTTLDIEYDPDTKKIKAFIFADADNPKDELTRIEEADDDFKQIINWGKRNALIDRTLKGITLDDAKDLGLDSDNWNVAGSDVFDENGERWGETFEGADGTIRVLSDQDRDASRTALASKTSTYPTGQYGTQAYSQSTLGGQQIPMGAAGFDPNLTTMDPYRYLPTADYAGALPSQLPGAQLPAISELYQQNIPAFQEAYNVAQLLGMVAADPDAAKGQTGTIGFQKFLQTNPDIKSIYSQGLNAIEGVKDQVRAGRMPETLSATDRMIYDKYIAGSPGNPLSGHQQELWLRMELSDYLPEAMRYSARRSLQRRYDAAVTGDPNALATSNIYGTSGNPWAGGTTAPMPVFGGNLSFGAGTPMGWGQTKPAAQPANIVGPTDNRTDTFYTKSPLGGNVATVGKASYLQGDTGTRKNTLTGMMEVYDLNTGQVYETYRVDPGTRKKTTFTSTPASEREGYKLKPFTGTIPEVSDADAFPMPPGWGMEHETIIAMHKNELEKLKEQERIRNEQLKRAQIFESPFLR